MRSEVFPSGTPQFRVLVISTHLRRDRTATPPRDLLQPITGLHIAAMLPPERYSVEIFNESWSGPFPTDALPAVDLVFLTGTQADFDRMRQISYHFRRAGVTVIAGGSICTLFPKFSTRFFDAVCAGTVEAARAAIADFERGTLRRIYRSVGLKQTDYVVRHAPMRRAGVRVPYHLIEASRGCKFKCSFCVIPAEKANKARYDLGKLRETIDDSLAQSPWWSLRARYPLIWFVDNNFADDPEYLDVLLALLKAHPRVRAWGALVTQNVLRNRALMERMRAAGCRAVFAGIESTDADFLKRFNKTQNISARQDVWSDIRAVEAMGIAVSYGFLFDPMLSDVTEMEGQIRALAHDPTIPFPAFFSFVIPLAGTGFFWDCAREGRLAPNIHLRDLDGQTVAFRQTVSDPPALSRFASRVFRDMPSIVPRWRLLWSIVRRALKVGRWNPVIWAVVFSGSYRMIRPSGGAVPPPRSFHPGEDPLDPQYRNYPGDISDEDRARYFAPIRVTDASGSILPWALAEAPDSARLVHQVGVVGADRAGERQS